MIKDKPLTDNMGSLMTATPSDVQTKIDAAISALKKTTSTYPALVKKYGSDWTKWPKTSNWYIAFSQMAAARTEAGQLLAPTAPTASFTHREV